MTKVEMVELVKDVKKFNAYREEHPDEPVDLSGADLREENLYGVNLRSAQLGNVDFGGADLRGADLRKTYLGDARLGGADFRGAKLCCAFIGGATLDGADLRGADLSGVACLMHTRHVGVRLEDAIGVPSEFVKAVMYLTLMSLKPPSTD